MTIAEFRRSCDKGGTDKNTGISFFDFMAEATEIWSNNSCLGYAIAAMKRKGVPDEEIAKITACMKEMFDELAVDEAEQVYCKSRF